MISLLGCSPESARNHIESLFKPGMTWDNWSQYGWHLDHITPLSFFDMNDPGQRSRAFHYTNLQPLWWHENLKKGARLPKSVGLYDH